MGNRFRDMPNYHTIIAAHGIIAAIVFLGLVPLSILLIRYYSLRNPYRAFKYHVWCQVLTLFLSTVVFVLGWFAVGPKRSLSNPHHGIGLAIYVIIIFQIFWGWLVHKIERNKKRHHVPLKLVVSSLPVPTILDSNRTIDSSVDRPCFGNSRNCPNPTWTHALWIPKITIYPIRRRRVPYPGDMVLSVLSL